MPMTKSSIAKNVKTNEAAGLRRVTDWTKTELAEIQRSSKVPVCIQLQSGNYLVGTFKVEKASDTLWTVDGVEFSNKRGAIFFCVAMHLRRINDANELRDADALVGNLELDKLIFRTRLDKAHLEFDQFKIDLYTSRYEDVKRKLVRAKTEFEQAINKIRYIMR